MSEVKVTTPEVPIATPRALNPSHLAETSLGFEPRPPYGMSQAPSRPPEPFNRRLLERIAQCWRINKVRSNFSFASVSAIKFTAPQGFIWGLCHGLDGTLREDRSGTLSKGRAAVFFKCLHGVSRLIPVACQCQHIPAIRRVVIGGRQLAVSISFRPEDSGDRVRHTENLMLKKRDYQYDGVHYSAFWAAFRGVHLSTAPPSIGTGR